MPGITLSVVKLVFTNIDNHINMSILSNNSLPVEDVNGTGMAKLNCRTTSAETESSFDSQNR